VVDGVTSSSKMVNHVQIDYKQNSLFSDKFFVNQLLAWNPPRRCNFKGIKNIIVSSEFTIVQSIYNRFIQNPDSKYQLNPGIYIC
jgi:hypothetical protein